jgi:trehalose-6-phosphatase
VTRYVDLAALSRRELENLLLTEHGALARILTAVRSCTEPEWKVRREVERIIEEAVDRRPFGVAYERGAAADLVHVRACRNSVRWTRWSEVDA